MAYKATGTITHIGEIENITESFSKQLVVLEVANGEYPEVHPIEFQNAKIGLVADLAEGQEVTIHFNIKGREWAGQTPRKFFPTLSAWKIESATATAPPAKAYTPPAKAKAFTPPAPAPMSRIEAEVTAVGTEDDLPF